jgi:MFS family permease
MSDTAQNDQWVGKWLVFSAVSLVFFFLNLATFTSLGVVLFTMVGELHWKMAAAGFSFSLLGIACGLSSPLPTLTMRRFGARTTICVGTGLLLAGFYLASISQSIAIFYVAMVLIGIGYSLAGNVPGVALIAVWFEQGSSRIIGFYLMLGALGAAFGPPIVEAIVSGSGGWRGHWTAMAVASAVIGVFCLLFVRDKIVPSAVPGDEASAIDTSGDWTPKKAIFTPQFMLVAAAMAGTMACITTNSSVGFSHLVKFGATPAFAATILSVIAITATLVKGVAGRLCESVPSPHVLAYGMVLQAAGNVLLAFASTPTLQYSAAIVFGIGWGLAYVAGTVVLLDYFGPAVGSKILSVVWLMTTVAAAGPLAAGIIADRYGTFSPIFNVYAVLLLALAIPIYLMREPVRVSGASATTAG